MDPRQIEEIQQLRVNIRKVKNTLAVLPSTRYTAMVHTSLEKAAMWLGDVLAVLGQPYPYPADGNHKATDTTTDTIETVDNQPINVLKALRHEIGEYTDKVLEWFVVGPPQGNQPLDSAIMFKYGFALEACYVHLREAKMDLGIELAEQYK